jgi:hypothetical protein
MIPADLTRMRCTAAPIISSALGNLVRQLSCVLDETFQEERFIALRIKISLLATAMTVLALCIIGVLYPGFLQKSFGGAVFEGLKGLPSPLRSRTRDIFSGQVINFSDCLPGGHHE